MHSLWSRRVFFFSGPQMTHFNRRSLYIFKHYHVALSLLMTNSLTHFVYRELQLSKCARCRALIRCAATFGHGARGRVSLMGCATQAESRVAPSCSASCAKKWSWLYASLFRTQLTWRWSRLRHLPWSCTLTIFHMFFAIGILSAPLLVFWFPKAIFRRLLLCQFITIVLHSSEIIAFLHPKAENDKISPFKILIGTSRTSV